MIRDLLLGLRLAVGGGRISGQALLRLVMTTFGVALVVAVLLPAASVNNLAAAQDAREAGQRELTEPRPGVDPLYQTSWLIETGEDYLMATVVAASGPTSPVPPGLDRIPGPGEVVVSPAAAEFFATPEGAPVRARIGGTTVGEIAKPGLDTAGDLEVFLGAPPEKIRGSGYHEAVYGFGVEPDGFALGAVTALLVAPIAVVLLLPLLIFVTTASRMGAAERERRLAALRLLGVSGKQVRRVAAAESLLGAVAGLVLGSGLFLALRPLIGKLDLFGMRFFPEDFVPSLPLTVLIAVLVPGLAVGAAIFGLRRTIVEPLGVVRQSKPLRRRMWWRWTVAAAGAALMGATLFAKERSNGDLIGLVLAVGSGLLLIGVAALLPWAVEKLVARLRGGSPSWQFAVRRLQLESGTASRVVSGLVVVLAGTILIQTLLGAIGSREQNGSDWQPGQAIAAEIRTDGAYADEAARLLAGTPNLQVHRLTSSNLRQAGGTGGRDWQVKIGDCAALATQAAIGNCTDGDAFLIGSGTGGQAQVPTGQLQFFSYNRGDEIPGPQWTAPGNIRQIPADQAAQRATYSVLLTPAALGGVTLRDEQAVFYVGGPGDSVAVYNAAALAVGPLAWEADVRQTSMASSNARAEDTVKTMRAILLTASLFVLAVAALSLLLLSIEQVVERRRPIAALSAAGVPLSVLARGSLWQNAIPVAVGIVLAIGAGLGITLPTLRYVGLDFSLDIGLVGIVSGAAVLAVLVATALTMPLLRQATRLDGLRAE
ncbi:FtsX-like permease family protein [Amycolatopsis suaedae]|uniref:FtsX-like permease family protein n=1 Tax=Amycolatopsis suaedae TaxID=2510978 RepID=A0A4Q7J0E4_9PSEU|nr:FtsX-like permease family protein [Amycolatopsis suaedae]RZQ59404.1 FtsX-like permease family protein [Amycolatopsis suaedae]